MIKLNVVLEFEVANKATINSDIAKCLENEQIYIKKLLSYAKDDVSRNMMDMLLNEIERNHYRTCKLQMAKESIYEEGILND